MTTRRSILAMAVAGATALGLLSGTAPAAWAQAKDIVYLTPGPRPAVLALSLQGHRGGSQEGRLRLPRRSTRTTAPRPSSRTRRTRSRAASPASCISPTDSSTAPSVLQLAARAKIPVVVADIGTNSGDYVSFIISDNYRARTASARRWPRR